MREATERRKERRDGHCEIEIWV